MAATNKDRNTVHKGTELLPVGMAAGVVIPAGVIVVANAAGFATNGATAVGLIYLGMADEAADNTGGADGAKQVIVRRERAFKFANLGADPVTQASLGKAAYIVDNQTVAATNGGNTRSPAGIVLGVEADGVWIRYGADTTMLINKQNLSTIFVALSTIFNNAMAAAPSQWEQIAMKVTSTTASNDYGWLSKFPKMRKWIGEKNVKALEASKYSIKNDDWEATVEVDRNDIEDDNLGIYRPQAQMAGESAKQLPDEIVFALVVAGFSTACYDGQYFFDTDHPVGPQSAPVSVSNRGTKKLSIDTQAAAKASFGAAYTAMRSFKDDEGRPLGVKPNILLVGPALEDTATALMTSERLEDGKVNLYRNKCKVVVADWIEGEQWFLLDTTKAVRPFIYQERKAPVFVEQTDPQSDDVFKRKKFKFGAEARGAGGYGFWQLAWGSDGTVA